MLIVYGAFRKIAIIFDKNPLQSDLVRRFSFLLGRKARIRVVLILLLDSRDAFISWNHAYASGHKHLTLNPASLTLVNASTAWLSSLSIADIVTVC
jgi:hypothetical protein